MGNAKSSEKKEDPQARISQQDQSEIFSEQNSAGKNSSPQIPADIQIMTKQLRSFEQQLNQFQRFMIDQNKDINSTLREYESINRKVLNLNQKLDEFERQMRTLEPPETQQKAQVQNENSKNKKIKKKVPDPLKIGLRNNGDSIIKT